MKYPPRKSPFCISGEIARPVFGLDIDGTLGMYHYHFLKFAEGYLGKSFDSWGFYRGGSLASFMKISKSTYREVKMAYRRGGLKRSMPVYEGASELARGLRERGAVVIICTTRPFLQLDNVEPDTLHWLRRHKIQHDGVLSGEHKYRDLARQFGRSRVVSVLEDLPALAQQAEAVGLICNVRDTPYNRDFTTIIPGYRCSTLWDAQAIMHEQLDAWERENR